MHRRSVLHQWLSGGLIFILMLTALPGAAAVSASAQASYIVQASSAAQAAQLVRDAGGSVTSSLDVIHAVAASLEPTAAKQLKAEPGVRSVFENTPVRMVSDGNDGGKIRGDGSGVPATDYPDVSGANLVWQSNDLGSGIGVAVL
ncbi:MAG TPA: protease inhibitor I9 family protein, partial [Anaerolineaceae bacterium]